VKAVSKLFFLIAKVVPLGLDHWFTLCGGGPPLINLGLFQVSNSLSKTSFIASHSGLIIVN